MKNLILIICLVFSFFSFAGEVTGAGKEIDNVLAKSNLSREKLKSLGLKLGEVTGAGKIHVDTLEMIVTNDQVISMDDVVHLEFKNPSNGQMVSEIEYFDIASSSFGAKVKLHQVKALITR